MNLAVIETGVVPEKRKALSFKLFPFGDVGKRPGMTRNNGPKSVAS